MGSLAKPISIGRPKNKEHSKSSMGLSSPHNRSKYSSVGVSKIKSNAYFLEKSDSITLNENTNSMPKLNLGVLPSSRKLGSRLNPDLLPSSTRPYSSST